MARTRIMRRVFEEIWNQHKLDLIEETHTPDFVWHGPLTPNTFQGRQSYRDFVSGALTSSPDIHFVIEDEVVAGDREAVRWTNSGTHKGAFGQFPPTGNKMENAGVSIVRLSGGKIAEERMSMDTFGFMQQIGAIPGK
jgi:steroid delta-isomerase-like uncharacterized protein